jgi:2-aminoethylphosphonate-pyruvate transaminase
MTAEQVPDNPYILLTPGPLSTSKSVKQTMLRDWCTWDDDYNQIVQQIRRRLVRLASSSGGYTSVLIQGSGTFCVESVITTVVPREGKLLVLANGAYGLRIAKIAERIAIRHRVIDSGEVNPLSQDRIEQVLAKDPEITHVAVVHCETTTGMLNPIKKIGEIVKKYGKEYIIDAMSSFGGIPLDAPEIGADYIVSSPNKCIQGVPGFGFVIALQESIEKTKGRARSLSLDLYDQWETMEQHHGKWRFTSPTHTVRAFFQALIELEQEGGVEKRFERYLKNHEILISGMTSLGFKPLLTEKYRSPIITSFLNPGHPDYHFKIFYQKLKDQGFVIYPGKVTQRDTFRIGNIGDVYPQDMHRLICAVESAMFWASNFPMDFHPNIGQKS